MKFFLRIVSVGLLLGVIGLGAMWFTFSQYAHNLPDYNFLKDYRPPILSRVYAGDGRLLSTIAAEQRIFVPIGAIPKRVINAFISAEDKDFYHHHGIDFQGVARAGLNYFGKVAQGKRPGGASTITQQVTKNFLLTNELSFERKIKEAILAIRLEGALSKDRILELYLNEIFLGNRSYGVAAAALNYFNRSLDELTVAEAAYLAALPKAPNDYHPVRDYEAALGRRNWVIGRMLEDGHITQDEARQALAEPLEMRGRNEEEVVTADYFAEEARRELVGRFGEKGVLEGGLVVRASLDPEFQDFATKALRQGLQDFDRRQRGYRGPVGQIKSLQSWGEQLVTVAQPPGSEDWELAVVLSLTKDKAELGMQNKTGATIPWDEMKWARAEIEDGKFGPPVKKPSDVLKAGDVVLVEAVDEKKNIYALRQVPKVQGAIVVMNPHTGRVYAMTGGFSAGISQFNRAMQAYRQPGSAFKPFVYLAALDRGFTPSSLVLDAPFAYNQGPGLPLWKPENYSQQFYGPTPLRVGLEKSRNVMTVRLANSIGMPLIVDYAKKFGIADDMPDLLSFSLGAKETTLMRLTTAYAMLVNGGKKIAPTLLDRVQDRDGHTIWRRDNAVCDGCQAGDQNGDFVPPEIPDTREQIADTRLVYQVVSMLEGVCQRGTAAKLRELGKPVAGKTGTTNESKDVWFIGFTPDLVAGVFVGFDDPQPLGSHETGASIAVPIFENFMRDALKDQPATPFRIPPGLRQVQVDAETGRLADDNTKVPIWESYIPGTEPTDEPPPVLDGSVNEEGYVASGANTPPDISHGMPPETILTVMPPPTPVPVAIPVPPPTSNNPPVTTGTGGLY
ncbi:MAG: penicillin-binding protein 1A [Alphaproteobacteria bacterium]